MAKYQEDNELLRSIQEHIKVESTDYSEWQRIKKTGRAQKKTLYDELEPLESTKRHGSACSTRCLHGSRISAKPENSPAAKARQLRMKELQVKIELQKQHLEKLKERKSAMTERNMKNFIGIDAYELTSHKKVNSSLHRYERCRDGISVLNHRYNKEKIELQKKIDSQKSKIDNDLKRLQSEVETISKQLTEVQKELLVLNDFKDKDYPLKVLQIKDLEATLQAMTIDNEDDEADLLDIIENEYKTLQSGENAVIYSVRSQMADQVLAQMHPSYEEMSIQNEKMKQDIKFHIDMNRDLKREIQNLEEENRALVNDSKTHIRRHMFPEVYKQVAICTPDTEIILDIPTKVELPV